MKLNGAISYVVTGLTLAIVIYLGAAALQRQLYLTAPINQVFEADVIVPDFAVGSVPEVQYERTIHQSFVGSYTVEVKDADTGQTVCVGRGENLNYEEGEPLPSDTDLMWYVGDACASKLPIGQYYLDTSYVIGVEGYPNRHLSTKSNVFHVKPSK